LSPRQTVRVALDRSFELLSRELKASLLGNLQYFRGRDHGAFFDCCLNSGAGFVRLLAPGSRGLALFFFAA
jgi:hypothetical protein